MSEHIHKSHSKGFIALSFGLSNNWQEKSINRRSFKNIKGYLFRNYIIAWGLFFRDRRRWLLRSFFDSECPMISLKKIVRTIKILTTREIFRLHPKDKKLKIFDNLILHLYSRKVGQWVGYKKVCLKSRKSIRLLGDTFLAIEVLFDPLVLGTW